MLSTAVMCSGRRFALAFGWEDENQGCEPYLRDEGAARQEGERERRQGRPSCLHVRWAGLRGGGGPRAAAGIRAGEDPSQQGSAAEGVTEETFRSVAVTLGSATCRGGSPRPLLVPVCLFLQSHCPSSDPNLAVQPDGAGERHRAVRSLDLRKAFNSASHSRCSVSLGHPLA